MLSLHLRTQSIGSKCSSTSSIAAGKHLAVLGRPYVDPDGGDVDVQAATRDAAADVVVVVVERRVAADQCRQLEEQEIRRLGFGHSLSPLRLLRALRSHREFQVLNDYGSMADR